MTASRLRVALAFFSVLLVAAPITALAQTGTATITGLVTDDTGAALPGVTVTATNQATNVAHVTVTNSAGNYTITPVTVGTYVIKAELNGFRTSATAAIAARGQAGRAARLQDGGRGHCRDGRGHRRRPDSADRDHGGRRRCSPGTRCSRCR